jgi:hypothetical protein
VRVYKSHSGIEAELWEHPRPSRERLFLAERLAVLGVPTEPGVSEVREYGQPQRRVST